MSAFKNEYLKWLNLMAFVIMIVVNAIAGSTTMIGGKSTAEISDANPTLITPAGYVFSIWGIIYILLGIFVLFQSLPNPRFSEFRERIGLLFFASSMLNVVWLFLWQFEYLVYSVVVMFLLLTTLIWIYLRLDIGKLVVSLKERIAFHLPFSVYLGWITIATIANFSATLVSIDWDGFGIAFDVWAILIGIIALLIVSMVLIRRKDIAFALVAIWAFVGIAVKQSANQIVVTTMWAIAIILLVFMIIVLISKTKTLAKKNHG